MVQVLYTIAALLLLGMTVLNINIKIHGSQERMMFNELALEVTSVGAEMLNEIGKYSYDPVALVGIYGYTLTNPSALRDESTFGDTSTCDPSPSSQYFDCIVINDFHGKTTTRTLTRTHNGTTYTLDYNISAIEVRYADEVPPHLPCGETGSGCAAGEKTFAKEVTVTVSTPALVDASGTPIEFDMSRVYLYPNYERGKPYSGS